MKYTINNIIDFLKDQALIDDIYPDTDICNGIGLTGDDFHEMIEEYSKVFSVDMTNYLWYFHSEEEGWNSIGGSFFPPPNKQVKRIPIAPLMLTEFANSGKWDIKYPHHKVSKRRYDLYINLFLLIAVLIWAIVWTIQKFIN